MALDPNQLDDDNLPLTADTTDDGYDTDLEEGLSLTPASKKNPVALIAILVALVGMGGAYFAYDYFAAPEEFPKLNHAPIDPAATPAEQAGNLPPSTEIPAESTNGLPPEVTAGTTAEPVLDPNAPPVDQATAVPVDPNAAPVAATETPADATTAVTDPAAVPTDPNAVQASAIAPLPPESAPTEPAAAPNPDVMPAPSEQQLKPIDPAAVTAAATGNEVAAIEAPGNAMQKKTADTMKAVNDILNGTAAVPAGTVATPVNGAVNPSDAISTIPVDPNAPPVAGKPAAPAPPVEVTSRAEQVIKVSKTYSARSPQAVIAAGDRVLADNQFGAAVDIYDKQLRQNPSDPLALAGKAVALQKANRNTEALDTYQRLIDLNPRDVGALSNYLGLLQKTKPAEAMARLNTLSEQYPDNASVAGQIAAVFANQADTPSALRYFMKARALDGTNATYPFNIAVLYDRMGNSSKASTYYREALNMAADNPNGSSVPVQSIKNRLRSVSQ